MDQPLQGEDPTSGYREDAEHWAGVYRELIAFKDQVMATIEAAAKQLSADAAKEVRSKDLVTLSAQREKLARRMRMWESRLREFDR